MTGGDDEVTLSQPNLNSRRSMWKSRNVARFFQPHRAWVRSIREQEVATDGLLVLLAMLQQ